MTDLVLRPLDLPDPDDVDESERLAETAAFLAVAGIDPSAYLRSGDLLEQRLLLYIARRVHERREIEAHNLAVEIANSVGQRLGL